MSARIAGRSGLFGLRFWYEPEERTRATGEALFGAPEQLALRNNLPAALAFVRGLCTAPDALGALRGLLGREATRVHHLDDDEVIRAVAVELISGRLIASRMPPPVLAGLDTLEAEPETREDEAKRLTPKTWIEIELLDTAGKPVPNEPYWIELPDGQVREGRLNELGRAYFGDLDPGDCTVRFPAMDDDAVTSPKPKLPPAEPAPPPKTWIEIQLVNEDGYPIAHERYRIALPDGEVREGVLDESGQARLVDIDPGACKVMFPAFEEEALERL